MRSRVVVFALIAALTSVVGCHHSKGGGGGYLLPARASSR
jgi:hypothetical protein